jgi:hypothetical protein
MPEGGPTKNKEGLVHAFFRISYDNLRSNPKLIRDKLKDKSKLYISYLNESSADNITSILEYIHGELDEQSVIIEDLIDEGRVTDNILSIFVDSYKELADTLEAMYSTGIPPDIKEGKEDLYDKIMGKITDDNNVFGSF